MAAALPKAAEQQNIVQKQPFTALVGMCMMLHGYDICHLKPPACAFLQVQRFAQKAAAAALAATLFTGWTALDAGFVPPAHANEEGNMSPSERRKLQMQKRKQLLSEA